MQVQINKFKEEMTSLHHAATGTLAAHLGRIVSQVSPLLANQRSVSCGLASRQEDPKFMICIL
jgi:plasmid maintenance system antidote protein VapI